MLVSIRKVTNQGKSLVLTVPKELRASRGLFVVPFNENFSPWIEKKFELKYVGTQSVYVPLEKGLQKGDYVLLCDEEEALYLEKVFSGEATLDDSSSTDKSSQ